MIVFHISGVPIEENVLQLAPAGAMMMTAAAIVVRTRIRRVRRRLQVRSRTRPPA